MPPPLADDDELLQEAWDELKDQVHFHEMELYEGAESMRKEHEREFHWQSNAFNINHAGNEAPNKKALCQILDATKLKYHMSMEGWAEDIEARENKIEAVATRMLKFIEDRETGKDVKWIKNSPWATP